MSASPYAGASIVFATRHGKAALARAAFASELGAHVVGVRGLDTDRFGTFTGEVARTLSPTDAALAKARLGMAAAGLEFGLASEATYRTTFGAIGRHHELLLFRDERRGLTVIEQAAEAAAVGAVPVGSAEEALRVAERWGFPRVGVAVLGGGLVRKNARDAAHLARAVTQLLDTGAAVRLERDHRAHRSPSRRRVIRALASRMARRLATACPACAAPGWGAIVVLPGAPCRSCGSPTRRPRADLYGCAACEHRVEVARGESADPAECDHCNP